MSNLLDTLNQLASPALISKTATALCESEFAIQKAIQGIFPLLLNKLSTSKSEQHGSLTQLLMQAGSAEQMPEVLLEDIASQNNESIILGIGSLFSDAVLDNKQVSLSNLLSNYAGIKSNASGSVIVICATLIASFVGKKMNEEGLSFNSILGWLSHHTNDVSNAIPSAFASMTEASTAEKKVMADATPISSGSNRNSPKNKWAFPVLLLALLGIGIFWWLKGCNNSQVENEQDMAVIDSAGASIDDAVNNALKNRDTAIVAPTESSEGHVDSAGNWVANKGDSISLKLNNGIEIASFKGSLEDKLFAFIQDPGAKPNSDVWFYFDDLFFEPGKSSFAKGSRRQLENVCEFLKAYPDLKIKLGGYTSNVGDSLKNISLSEARAKSVYNFMISKEIAKTSFDQKPYQGFGAQFPIAENSTAEGRAKNARISLTVTAK